MHLVAKCVLNEVTAWFVEAVRENSPVPHLWNARRSKFALPPATSSKSGFLQALLQIRS